MSNPEYFSKRALTRRDALTLGVCAGLGVSAGGLFAAPLLAADSKTLPLITKAIPASGEKIPVVGIGTNAFNEAKLDELRRVLKRFSELGATFIDTAASYGESEQTIGRILAEAGLRSKIFLATKLTGGAQQMGPPPGAGGPPGGGPPPGMGPMNMGPQVYGKESLDRSLERLKTDHLDLLQVHNMNGLDTLWPQLQDWKKAGKIRYIGTTTSNSGDHAKMVECMKKYPLDFVQVDYSIANRDAADSVFPVALERKIGVIVNVPFGGRGGSIIREATARKLPSWAADIDAQTWPQFLLKYVVSHPAVTVTIAGSTQVDHLEDNQQGARGRLPDAATRKRMEEYWDSKA